MKNLWWNLQGYIVWLYSQLFFHNICSSLRVCYQLYVQVPRVGCPKKFGDFTCRWVHKPAAPLRDIWAVLLVHDDADQRWAFASQERGREETIGLNIWLILDPISLNQPDHGSENHQSKLWGYSARKPNNTIRLPINWHAHILICWYLWSYCQPSQ